MSPTQMITLSVLCCYFAALVVINWRGHVRQSADSYAIGSRNVGYIATTGTLAAGIRDGSGIVTWTSFAFIYGYGGMWAFTGMIISFLLMGLIGPRLRKLSIQRDYLTINQMLHDEVGIYTQKTVTFLMLVVCLLVMSMQIYVSGNFFSILLQQPAWIGMLAIVTLVGFYLFLGGYSAVIRTNTFQFFWIISLLLIPFLIHPAKADMTNYMSYFSMPKLDRAALFIIGFLYPLAGGDAWQHIFSARSDRVIWVSFPAAGPVLFLMTLSLVFLGLGLKNALPHVDPKQALFIFFQKEMASPFVLSYIAVVIMAITTSDLDSYTYLFTSTAIKNIAPPSIANDKIRYKRWARFVLIGALIFTTLVALTINNIVQFLFQAVGLLYIMAPVFTFTALGWLQRSTSADRLMTVNIIASTGLHIWLFVNHMMDDHLILTTVPATVSLIGCIMLVLGQRWGRISRHA